MNDNKSGEIVNLADWQKKKNAAKPQKPLFQVFGGKTPMSAEVPCARCQKPVPQYADQCPHCGVYFSGRARDFSAENKGFKWFRSRSTLPIFMVIVLILSLIFAADF